MTYAVGALLVVVAAQSAAIVGLLVQRSRRSRAERPLRESEERFRLIAERVPVMVWTTRPDTTLDYLNSNCMAFTGLPLEQLLGEGWLNAVHPDDRERCIGIYVPAIEARQPLLMEYRIRRGDGVYRWFLDSGVPKYAPDNSFTGYIGCTIDITERHEAEDRIRDSRAALEVSHREIQHLAGRLIEAQDAERARVARDLHDDVSQQLAGLSIAFSGLRQQLANSTSLDALQEEVQTLQKRAAAVAQSVRHLSHDLHPSVLRHAGLVAALTSHCAELERTHGVTLICSADGDFASMSEEASLCLYRIAQEALRNVIAHAHASRADVQLVRTGDLAEITVRDDGRGFDVTKSIERAKGLGLLSMTERVRLAGGTVSIAAEVGQGTRVAARIPAAAAVALEASSGARHSRRGAVESFAPAEQER
jgi:PAS domain S-box-containing protein